MKVRARVAVTVAALAVAVGLLGRQGLFTLDASALVDQLEELKLALGPWALPAYVGAHTVTLALCLPYAVAFEAAASLVFGFARGLSCVFAAKVLGASVSFWIGRAVFRCSRSAKNWAKNSKYFHLLARGVEQDGWKFVLLARFSPLPSYVINYALAATEVDFIIDFLLPTVIGCLPMILQNTSIGSLAGAAVASTTGSNKTQFYSYLFPLLGIVSSISISLRIKKYSSSVVASDELKSSNDGASDGTIASEQQKQRKADSK